MLEKRHRHARARQRLGRDQPSRTRTDNAYSEAYSRADTRAPTGPDFVANVA